MSMSESLARTIREEALRRFLSYVAVHTTSDEDSSTRPSTQRQFDLAREIRDELLEMGARDVELDEHCYLYATVPASPGATGPSLGLLAHLDTSPSVRGENVKPVVHERYAGGAISFADDASLRLTPEDSPELREFTGEDIVTASGSTLLGADDKAGVAELVTTASTLIRHPELRHPEVRLCFTPDEEIGAGTAMIRPEKAGRIAYTLDGGMVGELEIECFDARSVRLLFTGMNMHPGYAKDLMVNAAAIAARFFADLPEWQTPEHTSGREGFYHLVKSSGDETSAELRLIVRDFAAAGNERRLELLHALRSSYLRRYPGLAIDIESKEQYRNMKEVLDRHPEVVEAAREAIRRAGVKVIERAIRGGTDGARLCFMGVPCPNIFAGGMLAHSRKEWIPVVALEKAVEVIINLCELWFSRGVAR